MRTSRNPNGDIEIYTDIGQYIGVLPPDYQLDMATDGGPGSGNFGHRGRPGKVGGSAKGGGSQYRGGRADIGYFSSRKDWLNGLSGEEQAGASRVMKQHGERLKHQLRAKEVIEKHWKNGLITEEEKEDALKKGNLDKIREDMTPEEFIMKTGSDEDKKQLLAYVDRARNWEKNRGKLIDENLTDEEKKIFDFVATAYGDRDAQRTFLDLKAKALGLPTSGEEIPDKIHYGAGTKEPPAPTGPDYSWVDKADKGAIDISGGYMATAIGEIVGMAHRFSKKEFADMNKKFLDKLAHGLMSPNEVSYYGVNAIGALRSGMREKEGMFNWKEFKYGQEHFDRLSESEKKELLEITNRFATMHDFVPEWKKNVEDLTLQDFQRAEANMKHSTPRKKEERLMLQRYLLLQDEMLTGDEPTPVSEIQAKKKAEQTAKAAAKAEAEEKKKAERAEKTAAWKGQHSPEDIEKMYHPETIAGVNRGKDMDVSQADELHANPDRRIHTRKQRGNCQTCVVAYELRRRGYDVEAKPRDGDAESDQYAIASHTSGEFAWIDPETGEPPEKNKLPYDKKWTKISAAKWLDSQVKDGERYTLSCCWRRYGAHIVNVERINGELAIIDAQSGEKHTGSDIVEYFGNAVLSASAEDDAKGYNWRPELMRIDNALPNPKYYDKILKKGGR